MGQFLRQLRVVYYDLELFSKAIIIDAGKRYKNCKNGKENIEAKDSSKTIIGIFINITLILSVLFPFLYWDCGGFRNLCIGV